MDQLTKKDIADFLKKKYIISNADAMSITEGFFLTICELAHQDGGVLIKNFGRFEFKEKIIDRQVRNFQTGDVERKRMKSAKVYFTPSKILRCLQFPYSE